MTLNGRRTLAAHMAKRLSAAGIPVDTGRLAVELRYVMDVLHLCVRRGGVEMESCATLLTTMMLSLCGPWAGTAGDMSMAGFEDTVTDPPAWM